MSNTAGLPLGHPPSQATPVAELCERRQSVCGYEDFKATEYFDAYYADVVLPDEQRVLAYQVGLLESQPTKFVRALEYGCGPTLHRAIAASRYVSRMDMADRVPGNLAQIGAWLKAGPENTDWNRFTRYVLRCESDLAATSRRVERREARTRRMIRNLHLSDARCRDPLGPEHRGFYDLMVSGFCIDAVSQDKQVWRECMRNVLSMLSEGGLLILHALRRCTAYRVGERLYPSADLCEDDLYAQLIANDFLSSTLDIEMVPCPQNARYGYSSVIIASGRKAWRRRRIPMAARIARARWRPNLISS